jgi:hypothetical protein
MQTRKIIILLLCCILCSCEKLLDKDPVDKLSQEETFRDMAGVKTALAGVYNSLLNYYDKEMMLYPDLAGGNIRYSNATVLQLEDLYHFIQASEDCSMNSVYATIYSILNNVNNILYYVPQSSGFTEQTRNRVIAEAQCMRALLHFDLLRLYARPYSYTADGGHPGIVINLQPLLYTDPLPERATVKACFEAIENDLLTAIPLFDNTVPALTGGYTQNYGSADATKALLARVYLYKGDWEKAKQYANELISKGGYALMTANEYAATWQSRVPSRESILEIAHETSFTGNSLGSYYAAGSSYQMFAATADIISLYSETDVRGKELMMSEQNDYYVPMKYYGNSSKATPVKLFRLSEMYLIRAEASAMLGDATTANADLNTIRKRGDTAATTVNITDTDNLLIAILLERRKELAFEGHFLFDLQRRKTGVVRNDCTAQNCSLPFEDYRMVLPIPMSAVIVNSKMKQNENY